MATQVNVREIILETLLLITRDGEYSHIALKNVLDKYQYLEKRERAFITRVVEGTLERQIEIDYIINQFSKVKVNKQKPVSRTILRSSVYQLKYMDHVPDSAVCNEAGKLAGKKGFGEKTLDTKWIKSDMHIGESIEIEIINADEQVCSSPTCVKKLDPNPLKLSEKQKQQMLDEYLKDFYLLEAQLKKKGVL